MGDVGRWVRTCGVPQGAGCCNGYGGIGRKVRPVWMLWGMGE